MLSRVPYLLLPALLACSSPVPPSDSPRADSPGAELESPGGSPQGVAASWLVDVSAEAGIDFVHRNGMRGDYHVPEMMGAGGALFDYDNDGDLDLYLVQGGELSHRLPAAPDVEAPDAPTDRLYRNDLDSEASTGAPLRFTDVTAQSDIRATGYGMGVATGDFDNDGWIDLYVTNFGPDQLWRNDGDGTFTEVSADSGIDSPGWSIAAAFFDYDRDGWLDLYVGDFLEYRLADPQVCRAPSGVRDYCGPLSFRPAPDRLYRNRGDGTFEDVSARSGIRAQLANTLGVIPADYDGDGWLDLYVANDSLPNVMWLNQHDGTFRDVAPTSGAAVNDAGHPEASMGVDAADVDDDGDEDLFMSHLSQETNTLYLNDESGLFIDASAASGLGAPSFRYTGFGTAFFDLENDGDLDLLVANGAINVKTALLAEHDPLPLRERNLLFRNLGGGRFEDVTALAGPALGLVDVSRGACFGDIDDDGDVDVVITNNGAEPRLLRNQTGEGTRWLGLRLVGTAGRRDMLGAVAELQLPDGALRMRRVRTAGSYASAHDPRLLFGLGFGEAPAEDHGVTVRWPGGTSENFVVEEGRYTTLVEGEGTRR